MSCADDGYVAMKFCGICLQPLEKHADGCLTQTYNREAKLVRAEQDACVAAALAWLELHAPEYYLPRAMRSLEIAIRHKGKVAT